MEQGIPEMFGAESVEVEYVDIEGITFRAARRPHDWGMPHARSGRGAPGLLE